MIAALALAAALAGGAPSPVRLEVPRVQREPERCGPAALEMVLGYYHADPHAEAEAATAYDPVLRGTLITRLAAAARAGGFAADVETPSADSLIALLRAGVPPIVLYQAGPGPITRPHYAVVVGWEPDRDRFLLQDGGDRPRAMSRRELSRRRRLQDDRALIVRPVVERHVRD